MSDLINIHNIRSTLQEYYNTLTIILPFTFQYLTPNVKNAIITGENIAAEIRDFPHNVNNNPHCVIYCNSNVIIVLNEDAANAIEIGRIVEQYWPYFTNIYFRWKVESMITYHSYLCAEHPRISINKLITKLFNSRGFLMNQHVNVDVQVRRDPLSIDNCWGYEDLSGFGRYRFHFGGGEICRIVG